MSTRPTYCVTVPVLIGDAGPDHPIFFGIEKHRGPEFLLNRVNGFGGKVELGETMIGAHLRELREESGIVGEPGQLFGGLEMDFVNGGALVDFRLLMLTPRQGEKLNRDAEARKFTDEGLVMRFTLGTLHRQRETMFAPNLHWVIPCMMARAPGGMIITDLEAPYGSI